MSSWIQALVPYAEFSRVGFVNILAFRLRYFTGIITYFLNVTVYYFIWSAVYRGGIAIAGYNLAQMITYVSVGWMIRSFYWNTIDQEMAYEVIESKIAMDVDFARHRRIGVSSRFAHVAHGRRGGAGISRAAPGFAREFFAVPGSRARQLLP